MFCPLDFRQSVAIFTQTSSLELYKAWVDANPGVEGAEVEDIPQGTGSQTFWVGKTENMKGVKVIYYFHGGGFYFPLDGSAMIMLYDFAKSIEKASPGVKVSIAVLDYSKSCLGIFP